jgi:hypothetical protein
MMMDAQTDPRKNFVPRVLPWLLAAGIGGLPADPEPLGVALQYHNGG